MVSGEPKDFLLLFFLCPVGFKGYPSLLDFVSRGLSKWKKRRQQLRFRHELQRGSDWVQPRSHCGELPGVVLARLGARFGSVLDLFGVCVCVCVQPCFQGN